MSSPPAGIPGVIYNRLTQSAYQVHPELLRDALHPVSQLRDASRVDPATRQAMRDLITGPLNLPERVGNLGNVV